MSEINRLPVISVVSGSDNLPVYSTANGDARKMSISKLLAYFKQTFTSPLFVTTITTPSDGFSITLPDDSTNQWALLRPTAALATGAIILPLITNLVDGQEIMITTTLQISSLTVNKNGASNVYGIPSALGAENGFKIRYNLLTTSWYKVSS